MIGSKYRSQNQAGSQASTIQDILQKIQAKAPWTRDITTEEANTDFPSEKFTEWAKKDDNLRLIVKAIKKAGIEDDNFRILSEVRIILNIEDDASMEDNARTRNAVAAKKAMLKRSQDNFKDIFRRVEEFQADLQTLPDPHQTLPQDFPEKLEELQRLSEKALGTFNGLDSSGSRTEAGTPSPLENLETDIIALKKHIRKFNLEDRALDPALRQQQQDLEMYLMSFHARVGGVEGRIRQISRQPCENAPDIQKCKTEKRYLMCYDDTKVNPGDKTAAERKRDLRRLAKVLMTFLKMDPPDPPCT